MIRRLSTAMILTCAALTAEAGEYLHPGVYVQEIGSRPPLVPGHSAAEAPVPLDTLPGGTSLRIVPSQQKIILLAPSQE